MTSQSAENFGSQIDPSKTGRAVTPSRDEILAGPADERLAWFASLTYEHPRLMTVIGHLQELMDPNNDIKIIALIGPTGIGKTTLIDRCLLSIIQRYAPVRLPHEVPVAVVAAPANGERSLSWRTMYRRLQAASGGVLIDQQRLSVVSAAELGAIRADRVGLAQRRELLEAEVRHRRVRLLGIDESHHLLRFSQSEATMDTLKSLADIQRETKLMLAGTYQIAPLLSAYGQLARRGAILHYSRYKLSDAPKDDAPTKDEQAFREVLAKIANDWPCEQVPNLEETWQTLMRASLGSVGLLKMQLQQLALLQTKRKREQFSAKDALRAFKASKTLNQIEREILDGEEELDGACYGDADFGTEEEQKEWLEKLGKRRA